jgi:hypothetical protein
MAGFCGVFIASRFRACRFIVGFVVGPVPLELPDPVDQVDAAARTAKLTVRIVRFCGVEAD